MKKIETNIYRKHDSFKTKIRNLTFFCRCWLFFIVCEMKKVLGVDPSATSYLLWELPERRKHGEPIPAQQRITTKKKKFFFKRRCLWDHGGIWELRVLAANKSEGTARTSASLFKGCTCSVCLSAATLCKDAPVCVWWPPCCHFLSHVNH